MCGIPRNEVTPVGRDFVSLNDWWQSGCAFDFKF